MGRGLAWVWSFSCPQVHLHCCVKNSRKLSISYIGPVIMKTSQSQIFLPEFVLFMKIPEQPDALPPEALSHSLLSLMQWAYLASWSENVQLEWQPAGIFQFPGIHHEPSLTNSTQRTPYKLALVDMFREKNDPGTAFQGYQFTISEWGWKREAHDVMSSQSKNSLPSWCWHFKEKIFSFLGLWIRF